MRPVVWWTHISFVTANSLLSWWSLGKVTKYRLFMKTKVSFLHSLKFAVEPCLKWTGSQTRKAVLHFLTYWFLQGRFVNLTCVRKSPLLAVHGCLFNISAAALSWRSPFRKTEDAPRPSDKDPIYFLVLPNFATWPQPKVHRCFTSVICFKHTDKPKHANLK
jgi:hypothetical protein